MDPKELQQEHKYHFEEFEILLQVTGTTLVLEALNTLTYQAYYLSLNDEEIQKLSFGVFTKTSELFEVLSSFLDEPNHENEERQFRGMVMVKFKKKLLTFQFKLKLEGEKSLSFSLDLIPKIQNKELRNLQNKVEELSSRLQNIETYLLDVKTVNERITALEQKYQEFANHKPEPQNPGVGGVDTINEGGVGFDGVMGGLRDPPPLLSFTPLVNPSYFTFKNKNTTVARGRASRKNHIVAWGASPLKKSGLQFFYFKIDGLNKGFQFINACIGVMTGNLYGKVVSLVEHDGNGCYFYGINSQCIWINNSKTQVEAKYGKEGDVFKVMVNFDSLDIIWQIDSKEIGRGNLDPKQVELHEFYPAVTLAYPKEAVSLI